MVDKAIVVRLNAQTGQYVAEMASAAAATTGFSKSVAASATTASTSAGRFGKIATTVGKVTALAVAGGLALSAKAAIDFESSFAGVEKTLDASKPQFEALKGQMRALARDIPIGVNELNRIAELGGQLGVSVSGITNFTETIAKIGVTTTLSTEQAALGFARLDNIMQLGQGSFGNMGSAIVELGNNFATTEDEILTFALRIAPAAQSVGIVADEVLAISAAFASVGVPAERGGTAVQKTLIAIAKAADEGTEKLDLFAEVAGLTADEFAKLFETDPSAAFSAFITGLGQIEERGGSTFQVLKDLGLGNERVITSLLAMGSASDVLVTALDSSAGAWEDNIALTEEAEKRFDTTESKLKLARNQIEDMAISIGTGLLPALGNLADGFGDFLAGVGALPDAIKGIAGIIGGLTLGLGAASVAVSKLSTALNITLPKALARATLAGAALRGLLGLGLGLAVGIGISAITSFGQAQRDSAARVEALTDALGDQVGAFEDNAAGAIKNQLITEGYLDELNTVGVGIDTFVEAVMGQESALRTVRGAFGTYRDAANDALTSVDDVAFGVTGSAQALQESEDAWGTYSGTIANVTELERLLGGRTNEYNTALSNQQTRLEEITKSNTLDEAALGYGEMHDKMVLIGKAAPIIGQSMADVGAAIEETIIPVEDLGDIIDVFAVTVSEGMAEIEADIRGGINVWDEYEQTTTFNVDKLLDGLDRQVAAQIGWYDIISQMPTISAPVRAELDKLTVAEREHILSLNETDLSQFTGMIGRMEGAIGPGGDLSTAIAQGIATEAPELTAEGIAAVIAEMEGHVEEAVAGGEDTAQAWSDALGEVIEAAPEAMKPALIAAAEGLAAEAEAEAAGVETAEAWELGVTDTIATASTATIDPAVISAWSQAGTHTGEAETAGKTTAQSWETAVVSTISSASPKVSSMVRSVWTSAGASAASSAYSSGANLGRSFASGISSQRGRVLSSARSIANAAAAIMRRALKIGSPSKVFVEIGEQTAAGFITGFEKRARSFTPDFPGLALATNSSPFTSPYVPSTSTSTSTTTNENVFNLSVAGSTAPIQDAQTLLLAANLAARS